MVIQVNGKVRDRVEVATDVSEADAEALALAADGVQRHLDGAAEEGHRAPTAPRQHRRVTFVIAAQ